MQAINRILFRKIVIVYPHLFRCSTIKCYKLLSTFTLKDLSVALLFITFFVVQFSRYNTLTMRSDQNVQFLVRFHPLSLFELVEIVGIEPATSCLQGRRSPS